MSTPFAYPFAAIVGQDECKLALLLTAISPTLSGALIRGEKGAAKSTAVRALAEILPEISVREGDAFSLDPADPDQQVVWEGAADLGHGGGRVASRRVRIVELPIGATEDRIVGALDLERAMTRGEKRFEPGLLAQAHRGVLYVDEINLLDDHLVDLLLDAAAMGVNRVEREGLSVAHPARFTLVGTMNPEEGELRPQLLDRFGLCATVETIREPEARLAIMARWAGETEALRERVARAKALLPSVDCRRELMLSIAERSIAAEVQGHRADIVTLKAAKALAAWDGREVVAEGDVERAASLSLAHRKRRLPFEAL